MPPLWIQWPALSPEEAQALLDRIGPVADNTSVDVMDALPEDMRTPCLDFRSVIGYLGGRPRRALRPRLASAVLLVQRAGAPGRAKRPRMERAHAIVQVCLRGGSTLATATPRTVEIDLRPGGGVAHLGLLPHTLKRLGRGAERAHLVLQYSWGWSPGVEVGGGGEPEWCRPLPPRLRLEAAAWLDEFTLANLCEVSRGCYRAFTADALWLPVYRRDAALSELRPVEALLGRPDAPDTLATEKHLARLARRLQLDRGWRAAVAQGRQFIADARYLAQVDEELTAPPPAASGSDSDFDDGFGPFGGYTSSEDDS